MEPIIYSIDKDIYKIDDMHILTDDKHTVYVWKYGEESLTIYSYWLYLAAADFRDGNFTWFGEEIPVQIKKICERFIKNRAFW
jgi:hypothetical protein